MVSMLELAQSGTTLCSPELQSELLEQDNIQRAIADGACILRSVTEGAEVYDPAQGYALEVTQWRY